MSAKLEGFVLSRLEYGDSALIIDFYSKENGRTSFSTTSSRKKNTRFYFAPLSLVAVELYQSRKGKYLRMKEVNSLLSDQLISTDSELHAIRYFLAEFLKKTLTIEENDPSLYNYLHARVHELYKTKAKSNFIIQFLEGLSPFFGIDLLELKKDKGRLNDFGFNLSDAEWNSLTQKAQVDNKSYLNALLSFYAQQFEGVQKLKSKSILAEVFN